jgi:hypothetical protein
VTERGLAGDRRGMSLPLVILLMAILAIAVTAGFARVSEERRIVGDQQAQVDAFAVAQSGLERYVALRDTIPGATDSVAIPIGPDDTAFVSLFRIRAPSGSIKGLYVLRSRGVSHGGRFSFNTPPAQRTVAQYATWQEASMDVDAAWTAIGGLAKDGNSGTISGFDACSTPAPPVAGAMVPVSTNGYDGYRQAPPPGTPIVPQGTPQLNMTLPDSASVAAAVSIDWDGIVNGSAIVPDYALTSTSGWPSSFTDWPMVVVDNPGTPVTLDATQTGQGILIITGDATLDLNFAWAGVVLIGGYAMIQGNASIDGALVTGLNVKLGASVFNADAGSQMHVQYHSCNLAAALAKFSHLQLVANAWTDSWPEN